MANKLANLQNALNNSTGKVLPLAAVEKQTAVTKEASRKAASRANQVNVSAWLHKDFKKSIRLVQAKKTDDAALQDLMAEAFNELFVKYNVPTVNQE